MNKLNLISAIFQLVSALVLVGISVYYYTVGNLPSFGIFLGVGIIFIVMSVRTLYKIFKNRKEEVNIRHGRPACMRGAAFFAVF